MSRAVVLRADAAHLPLPDASVDLIVTSPPYFGLRSYTDGGEHYDGQIGSEATPRAYLEALLACTAEWMRVLKPEGSLFVNLGDRYSTGNSGDSGLAKLGERWAGGGHSDGKAKRSSAAVPGLPPKTLLGMPWRYALGCVDDLGLILRAEIIWAKHRPRPVRRHRNDRPRRRRARPYGHQRRPQRRLLPPRKVAGQRPRGARQGHARGQAAARARRTGVAVRRRGGDRVSRLVTAAWCRGCGWTAAGEPEATDKAAEKHAAPGHVTATETKWN